MSSLSFVSPSPAKGSEKRFRTVFIGFKVILEGIILVIGNNSSSVKSKTVSDRMACKKGNRGKVCFRHMGVPLQAGRGGCNKGCVQLCSVAFL